MKVPADLSRNTIENEEDSEFKEVEEAAKIYPARRSSGFNHLEKSE